MLNRSSRVKPASVMPASAAKSIARLEGAPTAARMGMPAERAFCTSSKLGSTAHENNAIAGRNVPEQKSGADELIESVVASDIFKHGLEISGKREECRGMKASRLFQTPAAPDEVSPEAR